MTRTLVTLASGEDYVGIAVGAAGVYWKNWTNYGLRR
jgi:hypothetical protein